MDKFELICNLIIAIVSLVPTVISLVMLVRNIIVNKNWALLTTMAKTAMSTVEAYAKEHPGMTGEDKLNMAIDTIKATSESANVKVDATQIKKIAEYINELCNWSKTVNIK